LKRSAPAARASAAIAALRVSIEIGTVTPASRSPASTGITRRRSSASGTGSEPGRVDSPPMSRGRRPPRPGEALSHGTVAVGEAPAVGEAVGRHVDDAHQARPVEGEAGDRPARRAQPVARRRGSSAAGTSRGGASRSCTATRSNHSGPPASGSAPGGRSASV
jgi:hypothetical protein